MTHLPSSVAPLRRSKLTVDFLWTLIGRVAYGFSQWAAIVVLVWQTSKADVGMFSLAFSMTAPPMVFANLHLRNLFATDRDDGFSFLTYRHLRIMATLVGWVVCLIIGVVSMNSVRSLLIIFAVATAKAVETLLDLRYGIYQRYARMDLYGLSMTIRAALGLAMLSGLLWWTHSLSVALVGWILAWTGMLVLFDRPRSASVLPDEMTRQPAEWAGVQRLARFAMPMGILLLLDSLTQNVPRYLVGGMMGEEALGIYAPLTYIVAVGSALTFALGAPVAPRLSLLFQSGDRVGFFRLSDRLLGLAIGIGVAGVGFAWMLGPWFLHSIYGANYAAQDRLFLWVMMGGAFHYVMGLSFYMLTVSRRLWTQAIIQVITALVTTATGWVWTQTRGLEGAAQGVVVGMACGAVLAVVAGRRVRVGEHP